MAPGRAPLILLSDLSWRGSLKFPSKSLDGGNGGGNSGGNGMGMSNAERQKKWKKEHRVLYNLQRRNRRKGLKPPEKVSEPLPPALEVLHASAGPKDEVLARLRAMVQKERETPSVDPPAAELPAKPTIFYNDFGVKVPEEVWNKIQETKRKAKENGWEPDEFSQ